MLDTANPVQSKTRSRSIALLLVEDDDTHSEIVQYALRSCAHLEISISRANSLLAARKALAETPFDLVLLDLGLPESSGLKTLDSFLQSGVKAPVVVLTSISDVELGEDALKQGAVDFLCKDEISDRVLARVIRYSLERWRQKHEIEQSISDLERFGDAAAHDLISPLNSIQGFARLIEIGLEKYEIDQEIVECLELLEVSTQRAASLVNDLHKFARLGRRGIERETVDMNELVAETLSSLQVLVADREGTVQVEDLPSVQADRGLLAHVLQNLVSNGLKYRKKDVRPEISISSCYVNGRPVFCVSDNGIGIPESELDRIFEPFERVNESSKVDGSGLGLAICRRVIEAHEGEIWVDSQPNAGSSFRFYLGD